jgi:hypothetical protein
VNVWSICPSVRYNIGISICMVPPFFAEAELGVASVGVDDFPTLAGHGRAMQGGERDRARLLSISRDEDVLGIKPGDDADLPWDRMTREGRRSWE